MQAYARISSQADFIDGVTPDGLVLAKLGLICTVYFRNGGQRETGYKVLGCFDGFVEQFGEHLQGQFHDFSGRGFTTLRKDSIAKAKEKLSGSVDSCIAAWTMRKVSPKPTRSSGMHVLMIPSPYRQCQPRHLPVGCVAKVETHVLKAESGGRQPEPTHGSHSRRGISCRPFTTPAMVQRSGIKRQINRLHGARCHGPIRSSGRSACRSWGSPLVQQTTITHESSDS